MDEPGTSPSSTPKAPPDTVAPAVPAAAPRVSAPVNAKIAPLLRDAVVSLHAVNGAANYKATLFALRQTDGAAAFVAQTYHAAPAHEYMERWSLATVLADMHHSNALAPLHTIAVAPLPPVAGEEAPHILAEEVVIRTAAVEGIARQAARNPDARALLLQSVQSSVFSVKRAAAQAFLAHGGARADLEKLLPADQHFLMNIRTVSAAQLPTVAPPNATPRNPAREVLAPGMPGAAPIAAADDASRSK
jgi:hypothetical protein